MPSLKDLKVRIIFSCHSRESGNPARRVCGAEENWIPAFAGMAKGNTYA